MIDPITEQILIENQSMKMLKKYIPAMKKAIVRKDLRGMGRLASMLPEVNIKSVKRFASRMPDFRKNYEEAKKAITRSHTIDPEVIEPATVALALVASSTNKTCSEVLKRGVVGMPQGKILSLLLPAGSQFVVPLFKLNFFILAIMSIYVTGGDIIVPAVTGFFKVIGYLLGMVGKSFKAIGKLLQSAGTSEGKTEKAIDQINDMMGTNLMPPKVFGLSPELKEKMLTAGVEFGSKLPWGGEHLPGTAGLYFKTKK